MSDMTVRFPESPYAKMRFDHVIKDLTELGCSAEEISAVQARITEAFKDTPSILINSAIEDNPAVAFLWSFFDQLLQAEMRAKKAEVNKQKAEVDKQKAELDKQKAELDKQKAELDKQKAELETRKRTGEAFVCLEHLAFDRNVLLLPHGSPLDTHCGELIWNSWIN